MNVAQLLARAGLSAQDRPAVAQGAIVKATYGELVRRVARIGGALTSHGGLAPGERVAIVMPNQVEYLEVLFAIWWAGLVAVPVSARLHPREVDYIVHDSGARLCVVSPSWAEEIVPDRGSGNPSAVIATGTPAYEDLLSGEPIEPFDRAPTDTAWLFYTSGTTGRPKGVMITHRNLTAMTLSYFTDVDSITGNDSIIHAAPMSHGSGLYILPHIAKCALNVVPDSGGFDPAEITELVSVHRGVTIFAAPTMVRRLLDSSGLATSDMSNLKTLVYGGGPMYVGDLEEGISTLGQKFIQIYGQGESPMTISCLSRAHHADTNHPRYRTRLASVGMPFTGIDIRIAPTTDDKHSSGQPGEVLVRGDTVMKGYWKNPEATSQTLSDRWLHTGDIGYLDDEGFLTLVSRAKDLVISGGANIYPREVEEVLLSHEGIAEVAVVGRRHALWGEEVVAFVVLRPDIKVDMQALDGLCLQNLARFKRPRQYRFVETLPKNDYGKVLKAELRRRLEEETNAGSA